MRLSPLFSTLVLATCALAARAQDVSAIPPYQPGPAVPGRLIAWGNPEQQVLWDKWTVKFREYHPEVVCHGNLKSSATIAGALFTGVANLGIGGRELMPLEALAYRNIFNRDVFRITTSSGTFDAASSTPAIGVFVSKDNPINRLSFSQLNAIFGSESNRGAPKPIRTWGELGLTGHWANQPIHLYGHAINMPASAQFFAQNVFNGGTHWNRDLVEFGDLRGDGVKAIGSGAQIIQAVASDPDGIGYTSFDNRSPGVKSLALAAKDDGPFIPGTRATVFDRSYPLTRSTYFFINRDPAKGFDPVVLAFTRFVLSREGQQILLDNQYAPLPPKDVQAQLGLLTQ